MAKQRKNYKANLISKKRNNYTSNLLIYLAFIFSGALLAIPTLWSNLGYLSLFTLFPLIALVGHLNRISAKPRKYILGFWLYGITTMLITLLWINNIGGDVISNSFFRLIFIQLSYILSALVFSLGFLIAGWLVVKLRLDFNNRSSYFLLPAILVSGEFIRGILFSIFFSGDGGSVGASWLYGALALPAGSTILAFSARLLGFYGLSFIVVLINFAIYQIIIGKLKLEAIVCLLLVMLSSLLGYVTYRVDPNSPSKEVGVIHLGKNDHYDFQSRLLADIESDAPNKVQAVFAPEYAHIFDGIGNPLDKEIAKRVLIDYTGRLVTTQASKGTKFLSNNVVEFDSDGTIYSRQGKNFLVPGGEYIPYIYLAVLSGTGNKRFIEEHQATKTIYKETEPILPLKIYGTRYGAFACSAVAVPEPYRGLTNRKAEVLANLGSLSTADDPRFYMQSIQINRLTSIANNRYFVSSNRGALSFIMDNDGKIIKSNKVDRASYFTASVVPIKSKTPYTILGEWVAYGSVIGLLVYSYLKRKQLGLYGFSRSKNIFEFTKKFVKK